MNSMLEELLRDLINEEDIIAAISNGNAIAETLISNLPIRVSEEWIRIGVEGESHIHIKKNAIKFVKFVKEERSNGRTSFSIRLLDEQKERVLAIYFLKMYEDDQLRKDRVDKYEQIFNKYGSREIIPVHR